MSLTPEQIAELQAKANEADELRQRLAAVDGKKGEILDEKKQLQQQLQELKDREEARKKKELEEQGKTAELLEQERKEKEELRKLLEATEQAINEEKQQRVKDRVRADFISALNTGEVFSPEHAWMLLRELAHDDDGKSVLLYKGQKVTFNEAAAALRQDPQYAYLFKPKGASGGMGSRPANGQVDVSANPYLPGGSLSQRIALEVENPDVAAKLKAEASAARG